MTGDAFSPLVWPARLSGALERAWAHGIDHRPSLDAGEIVAAATRRAGEAPTDGPWRERLGWLCSALRDEAELNAFGRANAQGQLIRIVAARVRAERLWRRHPEILDRPITSPVAIVGQMRSGTTRMHRLLACDPAFVFTRTFESLAPVPFEGWRRQLDPRPLAAALGIGFLKRCNPALGRIHPASARSAEEEYGLHAFSLWGAQLEVQWRVPSYARRCEASDPGDVYDEFARLLQTIGWSRGDDPARTWLIKAPQFCQDLGSLIGRFPDLRIVRLSRRPDDVVASSASLAWHQTRIQSDRVDPAAIGAEWLAKTRLREARMRAALADFRGPRVDLRYEEVSSDWRDAVRRLYRTLGLELPAAVEARMAASLEGPARHHGHRYALEHFGLDRREVAAALDSQEAVGIDVDRHADLCAPVERA